MQQTQTVATDLHMYTNRIKVTQKLTHRLLSLANLGTGELVLESLVLSLEYLSDGELDPSRVLSRSLIRPCELRPSRNPTLFSRACCNN